MKRHKPLRNTGFKRKAPKREAEGCPELGRALQALLPRPAEKPRARMAALLSAEPPRPIPKEQPFRSEDWLRAVASIRCVRCGRGTFNPDGFAQSQAGHRNEGKGAGTKVDDSLAAALCPDCHTELDSGKSMTREQRRAEHDRCIVLTLRELTRSGRLYIK